MTLLLDHIHTKITLHPELEQAIRLQFKKEVLNKNDYLLQELQYCQKLYFLEKGTVRTFYYYKEKETSSWFYQEGQFFTSWYSFYKQVASFEYIEAAEDCVVYSISYQNYQQLLQKFPAFERFGRLLAEEQTTFMDYFSKGFMFMSAREKYDWLLSFFPDVTMRVNLGHIASFLGISQETLSRIRRKK